MDTVRGWLCVAWEAVALAAYHYTRLVREVVAAYRYR